MNNLCFNQIIHGNAFWMHDPIANNTWECLDATLIANGYALDATLNMFLLLLHGNALLTLVNFPSSAEPSLSPFTFLPSSSGTPSLLL